MFYHPKLLLGLPRFSTLERIDTRTGSGIVVAHHTGDLTPTAQMESVFNMRWPPGRLNIRHPD